ncbi:hypothetical protein MMP74_18185 [Acinetobacter sp. NIPH 1869]|uniref:hypothetical protein n=1 Tax=Acinetobacter higginsii TaxID=70347 RepID=UPI001F4AAEA8|nr:hypothetical protein [Acinetobacter higginsii]MCH7306280.1 hypothetical protein [Acinetobacter higginsii]
MPHKLILQQLQQQGRIRKVQSCEKLQRFEQEQEGLVCLQQRQGGYLNLYDQLFRLITMWLLQQDYDLTNHQPHQALKAVCRIHCPDLVIESVVQHRHELKKGLITEVSKTAWHDLQHYHHYFMQILQACDYR